MEETKEKLSYEQLEQVVQRVYSQNEQLQKALQESYIQNTFSRLNFLFKVLEQGSYFSEVFINKCTDEIVDLMTLNDHVEEEEVLETEEVDS